MNEAQQVVDYFKNFDYIPTVEEIHQFYPKKVSKDTVGEYCRKIKNLKFKIKNYNKKREKRKKISEHKVNLISTYVKLLSRFPQIKLIGLSGTVAMNNAQENDDIDLFIITARNRLWSGRLVSIVMGYMLGVRRKYNDTNIKNKVCLNLFFDESNLQVPKRKQTEYVAHEVLQMKPLINKDKVYERFIKTNEWVFGFFTNAAEDSRGLKADFHRCQRESTNNLWRSISNKIEQMLKSFQLNLIKRHQTTEIITDTQLWFFPDDYEKKIQRFTRM